MYLNVCVHGACVHENMCWCAHTYACANACARIHVHVVYVLIIYTCVCACMREKEIREVGIQEGVGVGQI